MMRNVLKRLYTAFIRPHQTPVVKFKRISPLAKVPEFSHTGDACADVAAVHQNYIYPGQIVKINLGFATEIPEGYFMEIRPRSGLSSKGITIPNSPCTIDAGYRGEWSIPLLNTTDQVYHIGIGDRIGQIRLVELTDVMFEEVTKLNSSARGANGYGSTGKGHDTTPETIW